jgi:hypothetical protein
MAGELDDIREAEEANYRVSLKLLGDSVSLVQDLVDLYKLIAEIASKSKLAARDEFLTGLHFLLAARYHLTIGALAALRGHLTDSLRSCRMGIELAAFAFRIKRQPELALVWLNAVDSDDAYARYNRIFSGQKLFPDDHDLLKQMSPRFDSTSKLSHPSIYSMAEHTKIEKKETVVDVRFHYFTVKREDPSEPTRTFLFTVDTHFGILRIFEEVLAEALEADRQRWDLNRNAVDGKLAVHKDRWKRVILGESGRPAPGPTGLIIIPKY